MSVPGPHAGYRLLTAGPALADASAAMVLIHGRGARAGDILALADEIAVPGVAYLVPQAAGQTWYPLPFTAAIAANEPWLSSALAVVRDVIAQAERAGLPAKRIFLLGFSQGACLATEFAARHARRYAGIIGLSGGLIGPPGTPRAYPGTLAGTPVFLGCSDVDPHIPLSRVEETADVFRRLGADVTLRIYAGMGHTINRDELAAVRGMVETVRGARDPNSLCLSA